MIIRPETPKDFRSIRQILIAAFEKQSFSHQTEHLIVEALRAADALALSLVAEVDSEVVGHIAFSAAGIGDASSGWFLLGPVAVRPDHQGRGIGRALIEAGLEGLRPRGQWVRPRRRPGVLFPFRLSAVSHNYVCRCPR